MQAFAPGKLFLFGEWSVLHDGAALLITTPAGQQARLTLTDDEPRTLTYRSSMLSDDRHFVWQDAGWVEPDGDEEAFDPVAAVLQGAPKTGAAPQQSAVLEIDPVGLADKTGAKLGFGSSAACAVLVAWAANRLAGTTDAAELLARAADGHRRAQQGQGSGADVAASAAGLRLGTTETGGPTVLTFRQGHPSEVVAPVAGLAVLAVWTGRPANTRRLMASVRSMAQAMPQRHNALIDAIGAAANSGIEAWKRSDTQAVLAAVRDSAAALERLGEAARVPIVTPEHTRIASIVDANFGSRAAAKPSGAGGGDMTVVFCHSDAKPDVVAALKRFRWRVIELST